jgi:hypothetical protein
VTWLTLSVGKFHWPSAILFGVSRGFLQLLQKNVGISAEIRPRSLISKVSLIHSSLDNASFNELEMDESIKVEAHTRICSIGS